MFRNALALCALAGVASLAPMVAPLPAAAQPDVRVEPSHLQGPRILADQTATAVVQNYIESWQSLNSAMEQNRPGLLDRDFVGAARDKLAATIQQQAKLGLTTSYKDRSHDIQIVFYSPEGLSIELTDNVEYDMQIRDKDKTIATQPVHERYIVVLTPTEVRWRVRVMQAAAQ